MALCVDMHGHVIVPICLYSHTWMCGMYIHACLLGGSVVKLAEVGKHNVHDMHVYLESASMSMHVMVYYFMIAHCEPSCHTH